MIRTYKEITSNSVVFLSKSKNRYKGNRVFGLFVSNSLNFSNGLCSNSVKTNCFYSSLRLELDASTHFLLKQTFQQCYTMSRCPNVTWYILSLAKSETFQNLHKPKRRSVSRRMENIFHFTVIWRSWHSFPYNKYEE